MNACNLFLVMFRRHFHKLNTSVTLLGLRTRTKTSDVLTYDSPMVSGGNHKVSCFIAYVLSCISPRFPILPKTRFEGICVKLYSCGIHWLSKVATAKYKIRGGKGRGYSRPHLISTGCLFFPEPKFGHPSLDKRAILL
jgi:hypothetical protein